jgi:hypothetical protein
MTIYRERLWPSPWVFLAIALVIPAALLVFLPINQTVGVITAIVLYAGCVAILVLTSPLVEVTGEQFSAGHARLPIAFAGQVTPFRGSEATLERGQRLDARAWLLLRGWVSPVVRVEVDDPQDPTPYWIVSTRQPERIAQAIAEARHAAESRV